MHWRNRVFNRLDYSDSQKGVTSVEMYDFLGEDSVTNYNWGGIVDFDGEFNEAVQNYMAALRKESAKINIPCLLRSNFVDCMIKTDYKEEFICLRV